MKKRLLSLALVLTMICSLFTAIPVSAASMFSDVNGHWAQATIEELASKGIVNGKGAGLYDPEGKVTRAEFSKLLMCTVGNSYPTEDGTLSDVPKDAWFNQYVYAALNRGIFFLNELDYNFFMPNESADRETVAVWAVRLLGIEGESTTTPFVDNSSIENKAAVATAYSEGIITGDAGTNKFRPDDTLTRAEAATIIKRVMSKYNEVTGLRPSKNTVEYKEGLNEVDATSEKNILISVDEEKGIFVFDKIDEEIRNLKNGDLFLIKPCDAIPSGVAIKVANIEIVGEKATIHQGDISLGDVIEEIDIAQEVAIRPEHIVPGSLGDGVTLKYNGQNITNDYLADNGGLLAEAYEAEVPIDIEFEVERKFGDHVTLTTELKLSDAKLKTDIQSGKGFLGIPEIEKLEIVESHNTEIKVNIKGAKEWDYLSDEFLGRDRYKAGAINDGQFTSGTKKDRNKQADEILKAWKDAGISNIKNSKNEIINGLSKKDKREEVKLASFNFPIAGGFFFTIDFNFTLEGAVEASGEITFNRECATGVKWTKDSGVQKISRTTSNTVDIVVAGEAKAQAGAEARIGLTFLYVVTGDVGVGLGVGAKASVELPNIENILSLDGTLYTDVDTLNVNWCPVVVDSDFRAKAIKDEDEVHTCDVCVDACLYAYLTLDAEVSAGVGKYSITLFNPKWEIFNEDNARILSMFLSLDLSRDKVVDGSFNGKCPYNLKTPEIYNQSEGKTYKAGDTVNLYVNQMQDLGKGSLDSFFNTKAWGNRHNPVLLYQWYKDNNIIEGANTNLYQINKLDENSDGVYTCVVGIEENKDLYVISKDIEVKIDDNVLEGGSTTSQQATVNTFKGSVSESNSKVTFRYYAPTTGEYLFKNSGKEKVFIKVGNDYKVNEGYFKLNAGQTYDVSIEWYIEDTNYNIIVNEPVSAQNISGMIDIKGNLTFVNEIKPYKYVPAAYGEYTFTATKDTQIIIKDMSGNEVASGNPVAKAILQPGVTYNIAVSSPGKQSHSYEIAISMTVPEE